MVKMTQQRQVFNKLRDFGLNSYEGKLWMALLSRGVSTAGELSDIANVPRSRSYDVLESLEKKGFIIMKLGKPIKYVAVQPREVLERVKKRVREDAEKQSKQLEGLRDSQILGELTQLHKQGLELVEPSDMAGSFRGRGNIYTHLESMIKDAKESVVLMTTAEGLVRKHEALQHLLEKTRKRGVKIRIAAPMQGEARKAGEELKKVAEIRDAGHHQGRFCIVDNHQLLFMTMDDKEVHPSYDVGVWVNAPYFAKTFKNFFDTHWERMRTV